MTRERIKDFKEIVLPFFTNYLLKKNYENLGKSDAEEFEKDFSEIIELADKALEQQPCEDAISRADVEQTVEDNILCYTHSDRPIDQDPDTECDMAIRMALRMLRKDLRKLPPVTPRSLNPEADREESKAYCAECDHIEMCSWYPHDGCEWLKTDRYNAGYNAAKREIALSGEYERAYERGKADAHPDINDGKLSEIPTGSGSEEKE